jgi:hypothetical protein
MKATLRSLGLKPINKVQLISRYYKVTDGKHTIFAMLTEDSISLTTNRKMDNFVFKGSKPEMIKAIAKLMLEVVKIDD